LQQNEFFSGGRDIISIRRSRLSASTISCLMLSKHHLRLKRESAISELKRIDTNVVIGHVLAYSCEIYSPYTVYGRERVPYRIVLTLRSELYGTVGGTAGTVMAP
jgi:hypothetical protein